MEEKVIYSSSFLAGYHPSPMTSHGQIDQSYHIYELREAINKLCDRIDHLEFNRRRVKFDLILFSITIEF